MLGWRTYNQHWHISVYTWPVLHMEKAMQQPTNTWTVGATVEEACRTAVWYATSIRRLHVCPWPMGFRLATGTGTLSLPFIEPLILSLETWISTFSRPLGIISDVSYLAKMEWENMTVVPAHILQCWLGQVMNNSVKSI